MLRPARTCGGLSKCRCISSPLTLISTENGSSSIERRIVVAVGETIGAVGNGSDTGAHLALRIVQQRVAGRQHHLAPILLAQRLHALTPRRLAAICARRSESRSRGTWQFSRMRYCTSSCSSPAR